MNPIKRYIIYIFLCGFLGSCISIEPKDNPVTVELLPNATTQNPPTPKTGNSTPSPKPSSTPSPSHVPSPETPPILRYDELAEIIISVETSLIVSPSHPDSQLPSLTINQGEKVQVIGSDLNSAWLLVLHKNTLGWIPAVFSSSGAGTLDTLTLVESQIVFCKSYYGSVNSPSETWEINVTGNVVVQGLLYLSESRKNSDDILISVLIEETGKELSMRIEQSVVDEGGGLFLFTSLLENTQMGNHIRFRLESLQELSIPFQAGFFSDECGDQTAFFPANSSSNNNSESPQPMATRIIKIQSTVESSPVTVPGTNGQYCSGGPVTRVQINDLARVTYTDGTPLRLRKEPKIVFNNIIAKLSEGTQIKIFDGPVCVGSYAFWYVKVKSTGVKGWVAEGDKKNYYIETIHRP